jgi:hypothetical protein
MTDRTSHPVLAAAVTGAAALSGALIGYALARTPAALPAVAGSAALTLAVLAGCALFRGSVHCPQGIVVVAWSMSVQPSGSSSAARSSRWT